MIPAREESIDHTLRRIHARIAAAAQAAGRDPDSLRLLAVSKTQPAAAIASAALAGQRSFGESYAREAVDKITALSALNLDWHFIGQLQSNKIKQIAQWFSWVHSLDDLRHAELLNSRRPADLPRLRVCLQVNLDRESQKGGLQADQLTDFILACQGFERLELVGLMAIPAPRPHFAEQRASLARLRILQAELRQHGFELPELSMGMSDDLEAAIAEGATWVRIGTAIFGARHREETPVPWT